MSTQQVEDDKIDYSQLMTSPVEQEVSNSKDTEASLNNVNHEEYAPADLFLELNQQHDQLDEVMRIVNKKSVHKVVNRMIKHVHNELKELRLSVQEKFPQVTMDHVLKHYAKIQNTFQDIRKRINTIQEEEL